jgi:hypothetical protein
MSRNSSEREASRRTVLRTVGAAGLAAAATGSASAQDTDLGAMASVADRYAAPSAAREAATEHAGRVLSELADRGYLDAGDASAFDFSPVGTDRDGARTMSLRMDGTVTAQIAATRSTDGHEITLVVRPELGESYASVKPTDGGSGLTVRDDGGDVGTQGCWTESRCTCEVCDLNSCIYQERNCCDGLSDGVDCGSWSDEGCCGCCCCD